MGALPNKELTDKEYQILMKASECSTLGGGEGKIVLGLIPHIAFKVFHQEYASLSRVMNNKYQKLKWLYNKDTLDNELKILGTLTYYKRFITYAMTHDKNNITLLDAPISKKEKVPYLKQSKAQLEHFHKRDVVYGDVKANNILVNLKTGTSSFCDLDNIQIEDKYPIDILSDDFSAFADEDGFVKETADYYMHSLMTLSELDGKKEEYYQLFEPLSKGYKFDFLEDSAQSTLEKIWIADDDYKGDYLIDYVKTKKERRNQDG